MAAKSSRAGRPGSPSATATPPRRGAGASAPVDLGQLEEDAVGRHGATSAAARPWARPTAVRCGRRIRRRRGRAVASRSARSRGGPPAATGTRAGAGAGRRAHGQPITIEPALGQDGDDRRRARGSRAGDRRRPGPAGRCSRPRGAAPRPGRTPSRPGSSTVVAGSLDDDEPGRSAHLVDALPGRHAGRRVLADDHEELALRVLGEQLVDGVDGEGVAAAVAARWRWPRGPSTSATAASTMARRSSAGLSGREPTFCHGRLATVSSTRSRCERVAHVDGGDEVTDVRRVEGAAEDTEPLAGRDHRTSVDGALRAPVAAPAPKSRIARTRAASRRSTPRATGIAPAGMPRSTGRYLRHAPRRQPRGDASHWNRQESPRACLRGYLVVIPVSSAGTGSLELRGPPPSIVRVPGSLAGVSVGADMSDSVGQYLNEIGLVPLLTAQEERELSQVIEKGRDAAARIEAGERSRELQRDVRKAAEAKDRFIRANLRLVVCVARRYPLPPGMELLDLIQEGNLGPRARRRQVRLAQGLQVLHLRHVLDPPGHRPGPRPEGLPRPAPGRSFGQPPGRAAPGVRRR